MATTKLIPFTERKGYFAEFTRRHLADGVPKAATIEMVPWTLGDQFETTAARLLGLDYDPMRDAFAVLLEHVDHLVSCPTEIWVIEEDGGFITTLEVICSDGTQEIIHLRRSGPPARRQALPLPF
jgi:hypothetical protein